jgi:hypothetical protein
MVHITFTVIAKTYLFTIAFSTRFCNYNYHIQMNYNWNLYFATIWSWWEIQETVWK